MIQLVNDNLYETRNDLVKEIALLSNDQFNSKPDKDKWSIAQICHHFVLVEESSIKAIAWGIKGIDNTQKNGKKFHLFWIERKRLTLQKLLNQM